jgi:SAM-dependent methyltransferase
MRERFAQEYEDLEQWHWWFRGRQRILEAVLKREFRRLPAPPHRSGPRRLATLGCGPASGLEWLVAAVGEEGIVIGIDSDPTGALRRLSSGARSCPRGVAFVYGQAEEAPLLPASCDAVLALDVLEHIDDDASALAEAARLVRPGGLVLVTVPALASLWGNQDVVSEHKRRYTGRSLAKTFDRARLSLAWQTYFNTALFPVIAGARWTRRLLALSDDERSDFEQGRPGRLNDFLTRVFAAERHLVGRARLPIGVSLLAVGRLPEPPSTNG